ncbi:unnamed protein product, partial [Ascophyllum nodosum]
MATRSRRSRGYNGWCYVSHSAPPPSDVSEISIDGVAMCAVSRLLYNVCPPYYTAPPPLPADVSKISVDGVLRECRRSQGTYVCEIIPVQPRIVAVHLSTKWTRSDSVNGAFFCVCMYSRNSSDV